MMAAVAEKETEQMQNTDSGDTTVVPSNYGCEILLEKTTIQCANDKSFPTDARLITYIVNGTTYLDLTRGKKMVSIFDFYYDRYGAGALISIDFGYGQINPKMWGYKPPGEKKKRK